MNQSSGERYAVYLHDILARTGDRSLRIPHLTIERGLCCAVLGADKDETSLLLKVFIGLVEIETGHLQLLGQDFARAASELWNRVFYLSPNAPHITDLTVNELLKLTLRRRNGGNHLVDETRRLLHEAYQLERLANQPIINLSPAEHLRLKLAVATAQDAALVLLHDPLAQISQDDRNHMGDLLLKQAAKHPLVYTTTNIKDASAHSDYIILVQNGTVVAHGPTAEMLAEPDLSVFRVDIVGNPSIVYEQLSDVAWVKSIQANTVGDFNEWVVTLDNIPHPDSVLLRAILADRTLRISHFTCIRPPLTDILAGFSSPLDAAGP